VDCPKLFPRAPQTSATPSNGRRYARPMTKKRLLEERRAAMKRTVNAETRSLSGPSIRGRWRAPGILSLLNSFYNLFLIFLTATRRQADEQGVGPAFDGSLGIDAEDILNIPQIGFGTFQLFPDQNNYGPNNPNLPPFNNTVQTGLTWIQNHAEVGKM
jgi:mannan endo-1,4-beta-mannosidase